MYSLYGLVMVMQDFSRSLPMMLYRALDAVMPRFRTIFLEFGLTEQQWRVLRVLWEHDQMALLKLAGLTLISAPSLVGVVDRLQAAGLVTRRRSETDRRVLFVVATQQGHDLKNQVMPRVQAAYAELEQSMDAEEWGQILHVLESISSLERPLQKNGGVH